MTNRRNRKRIKYRLLRRKKIYGDKMELWDIFDKNGNLTGKTMKKGSLIGEDEYHLGMEAWIVNKEGCILIQQRSKQCEILPDIWGHTTGRILAGENSMAGCIREIKEELGMTVSAEEIHFIRRIIREDIYHIIWDIYLVETDIALSEIIIDEREVALVRWVTAEELKELILSGDFFEYPEIHEILSYVEKKLSRIRINL